MINSLTSTPVLSITKWFNNKPAAVSLRFDDNLDSHVNFVIPHLNKKNIKATFMINPGRNNPIISYNRYKKFWENELPALGHRLGNHTWNHKGAKNLKEADYEIGEVSKLIWELYPNESKLNVFASGGGETWGGRRWRKASFEYKELTKKYSLLDLYSSEQQRVELNSNFMRAEWKKILDETVEKQNHRAFVFHKVGKKSILDHIKQSLTGYNNCIGENDFEQFINDLNSHRNKIWIAPVIDILKYEKERESVELKMEGYDLNETTYSLKVLTDPILYDHPLSLIVNSANSGNCLQVFQDNEELVGKIEDESLKLFNIKPTNSSIRILNYSKKTY